jgi:hypothetical protein
MLYKIFTFFFIFYKYVFQKLILWSHIMLRSYTSLPRLFFPRWHYSSIGVREMNHTKLEKISFVVGLKEKMKGIKTIPSNLFFSFRMQKNAKNYKPHNNEQPYICIYLKSCFLCLLKLHVFLFMWIKHLVSQHMQVSYSFQKSIIFLFPNRTILNLPLPKLPPCSRHTPPPQFPPMATLTARGVGSVVFFYFL